MYEFIFEIYSREYHCWYTDFTTRNISIANQYFDSLIKLHNPNCVRVITRLAID